MEACLYEVFGKTEQEIQISSLTQSMQTRVGKITDDMFWDLCIRLKSLLQMLWFCHGFQI